MREGLRWIAADPARWLALAPKKLAFTFDHESFPIGYLAEADREAWPPERQAAGRGLLTTVHRALLAVAPLGLVGRPFARGGLRGTLGPALAIAAAVALALQAALGDAHAFWPLALLVPAYAALPLATPRDGRAVTGYLALVIATVCVTHAVFFGEDRYHVVATPALCVLAACALRSSRDAPAAR
jgi:hypothetical protein